MKTWRIIVPAALAMLLAGQAFAQGEEEERRAAIEAREAEVEMRLREAEEKMAEAARTIAELTKERLPQVMRIEERIVGGQGRPRLGVAIGTDGDTQGPVEGVSVMGVTPGSAADDAGLRSGDVITSVNDESLSAPSAAVANERLLDFMKGVEEGDRIAVEYLRDGKVGKVEVEPRLASNFHFDFRGPDIQIARIPEIAPELVERFGQGVWFGAGHNSWGDMELAELSEGLGKYFGAKEGLLVVSAPESNALQLQDGDVIQSIDGRKPKSVGHAMRILGSYQSGETLELTIMRDKKRRTLEIEMPENERIGRLLEFHGKPHTVEPAATLRRLFAPRASRDSETT